MESRAPRTTTILAALCLVLSATATVAAGSPGAECQARQNATYKQLLRCMTAEGVLEHLEALQVAADANDDAYYPGTRAAGTAGYEASVDHVVTVLEAAGWDVTLDPVEATFNFPATLRQLTPTTIDHETGVFTGSGDGTVEGPVVPVDLSLGDPSASTSGCEASDFAGLDLSGSADIALVQRGACFFSVKARNAQDAGAEAVVIFNQGTADRQDLIVGNASSLPDGSPSGLTIPVVGASFPAGQSLAETGSTALVQVLPAETIIDHNVIAELPGRNHDNVVMAGAHLDSVIGGAGIQDNGSGSATLLELAELLGSFRPDNTLRFAWWAAEEQGLVGSESYVANLPAEELDRIAAYVNFDMIASPNHVFFVYDADESTFPAPAGVPIPPGSQELEDLFEIFYSWQDVPYDDTEFSGRSDYQAFIESGIPASGLFTGAEVTKNAAQVAIWGGLEGEQYDVCYHEACDDLRADSAVHEALAASYDLVGNVNLTALDVNADAVAFAILSLAYSTEDVNGVPGRDVPDAPGRGIPSEPDGEQGTRRTGGGGLEHDHTPEPA